MQGVRYLISKYTKVHEEARRVGREFNYQAGTDGLNPVTTASRPCS